MEQEHYPQIGRYGPVDSTLIFKIIRHERALAKSDEIKRLYDY